MGSQIFHYLEDSAEGRGAAELPRPSSFPWGFTQSELAARAPSSVRRRINPGSNLWRTELTPFATGAAQPTPTLTHDAKPQQLAEAA